MEGQDADVVVIGAGAAGLCVALAAAPRRVLMIAPEGEPASCTELAQGGIAAPVGANDSVALHVIDTVRAGAHAVDQAVARSIIERAADAIGFLGRSGVEFDRAEGPFGLHLEAGHGRARILHAGGDRTGAAIHGVLLRQVRAAPHVALISATAVSLLRGRSGIAGVVALDPAGAPMAIQAADTVVCTGGVGRLFASTTNPPFAAGDGLAMALVQGARTAGLEFVQFHPTALHCAADPLPLLTEALRGAGAKLTANGRPFMASFDPRADLAPRDIVARAVWRQKQLGAFVALDATGVFGSKRGDDYPGARSWCRSIGIDPAVDAIPVTWAAHFHMGGIVTDIEGRTSLPGLWAAGEVAFTGIHGANRLASNSLLEAVVVGRRTGEAIGRTPYRRPTPDLAAAVSPAPPHPRWPEWDHLRSLMDRDMGPVRFGAPLAQAFSKVTRWREQLDPTQATLRNRLTLAQAMIAAALRRRESRGAHWRGDHVVRDRARDGAGALLSDEPSVNPEMGTSPCVRNRTAGTSGCTRDSGAS